MVQRGIVACALVLSVGCNSNYWTEDSVILTDALTLEPGDSQRFDGTMRAGGDLGTAEVDFCALVLSALYDPADADSADLRIELVGEEPAVLPTSARYRFNEHLENPRFSDPSIEFTTEGEECAFTVGFSNVGDEALELGLVFYGRFGGAEKTKDGVEVPPAPVIELDYEFRGD
ncbi:MAG: hypothetical protein AAFX94_05405 [Myxococcota bacterium]